MLPASAPEALREKERTLASILEGYGQVALAFSGGVDSTLLLDVAHEVLGSCVVAFTVHSAFVPEWETSRAHAFCEERDIAHRECFVDVLADSTIAANPKDRCYHCKLCLFSRIAALAKSEGIAVLLDGTNTDDANDYRPGAFALQELKVQSPFAKAGFSKADIRALSRLRGLSTADAQSYACLATRFPYGQALTNEGLARVDAAEQFLMKRGFEHFRVRCHGTLARLEVRPDDFKRVMASPFQQELIKYLKELGFTYITLDLEGFRSGSMNEEL